jgi:molybdopterin/thiamine biosynthesis adenylyltransferase
MSEVRAAIDERLWAELAAALLQRDESAGIILAGTATEEGRLTLCLNSIRWAPEETYELRAPRELRLRSDGFMPALGEAAADGWQPIFFHTHPAMEPAASRHDRLVAQELAPVFEARTGRPFASLILGESKGRPSFTGTYSGSPWRRLRRVGERLRIEAARDFDEADPLPDPDTFDRQIRAFGPEGQALLRRLRVGIVGASGTGSPVFEQLVRLGVSEIVVLDPKDLTAANVTRVHGSGSADVGDPKVAVLERSAAAIGLGTEIEPHQARVTERAGFEALRGCDVVFGCTDDNAGRAVLSRLAYHYCLMVIDLGVLIGGKGGEVTDIDGRVTVIAPGTPCLHCRDRIDPNRLREESLPAAERKALAAEGYAQGLDDPDPAVITYTTMIATFGVDELLQRLFGFGDGPSSELLVRPTRREIRRLGGASREGHFCADPRVLGRGDREPPLGLGW